MRQSARQREIIKLLESTPGASVDDLCAATRASPATIRRDLTALSESGQLRRVHGGAEATDHMSRLRGTPFSRNILQNVPQKKAIAKTAADLCREGEAIIIDAGSTTFFMCQYLLGRSLQVLTNSIPIVQELLGQPSVRLHVPGGEIYREQDIILSPFQNNGLNQYAASKLFMGAGAISTRGILQADSILVQAEQRMLARADQLVVLADSSKFAAEASLIVAGFDQVSTLITDDRLSDADAKMIERSGVDLITVGLSA
ncbi:MAG: DeoR/GlpR family DNA-binding transcription regulator [Pseudomonadota bacterium]